MQERLFRPLKMSDTAFHVPAAKMPRLAEPFPKDPATGANNKLIDVSKVPGNDSGGAGAVGTAGDYLRYCQAMLNGGQLDGARILSPTTVRLMTSDHLAGINTTVNPGNLLLGSTGYTFGLGFLVRQGMATRRWPALPASSPGPAMRAPTSGPSPRTRCVRCT